jgi:mono/diheme cytochrome c family protein
MGTTVTRRTKINPTLIAFVVVWAMTMAVRPHGAQEAPATVWDGVYTIAQADRGAVVYKSDCASCHGDALTGVDEAPALLGTTFLSNWNGQSVGDLVDLTRKSMPKDNENTLTRQQYVDVTAHVLRANKFPVGQAELPTSGLRLGQIRIDAFRQ